MSVTKATTTDAQVDSLLAQMDASGDYAITLAELNAEITALAPLSKRADAGAKKVIKAMLDAEENATDEQRTAAKAGHGKARKLALKLSALRTKLDKAQVEVDARSKVYALRETAKSSMDTTIAHVKPEVLFLDSNMVKGADMVSMQVNRSGIHNAFCRMYRVDGTVGIRAERANGKAVDVSVNAQRFLDMLDLFMWEPGKTDGKVPAQIDGISTTAAHESDRFVYAGHGHTRDNLTYFVVGTGRIISGFDSKGNSKTEKAYNPPFNVSKDAWKALGLDGAVYPI